MDPYPCQMCRRAEVKIYEMQGAGKSDQQILSRSSRTDGKGILRRGRGYWRGGVVAAGLIGLGIGGAGDPPLHAAQTGRPLLANAPEIDPETMARIEKDLAKLD